MNNSKNRIIEFLFHLDMGQNAFEKKVGIANGYISKSKGSFGSGVITKIANAYPELNPIWLLTGEGAMLKTTQQPSVDVVTIPRAVFDEIAELAGAKEILDKYKILICNN